MTVYVSLQATGLAYMDRDAMLAQSFTLPNGSNPNLIISPTGYAGSGYNFTFRATGFNTSSYPGPQTLFVISYTGTPDCTSPLDTTLQISSSGPNGYSAGGNLITISTGTAQQSSIGCNYILGNITSPFGDPYCENSINGGVIGVDVNAYFRTLVTPFTKVTVGSNFQKTGNDGRYLLESLPAGTYLKVRPDKLDGTPNGNGGYNNAGCGLSTIDTKMMQNYILGISSYIALFQYPWQLIAGDVNLSGSMSSYDITLVNAIIAGTIQGPWTFVPPATYATFAAPDGTNFGYSYDEELSFSPLNADQTSQDYYGIKLGDVDGTCIQCPGFTGQEPTEDRADRSFITIPLSDRAVRIDQEFVLPIRLEAAEPMEILAWQVNFDPEKFEFQGIRPGTLPFLDEAVFHLPADEPGTIRFVWTNLGSSSLDTELRKGLFSILLRAKTSLPSLQEYISVTTLDNNASFGPSWTEYQPVIKWSAAHAPDAACTVSPVPFGASFQLSFHTDRTGPAYLRILSAAGRVVHEEHTLLSSGDQTLEVQNTGAWPAGVYMYELCYGPVHHSGRIVKD